jgi:hypothetical protein
MDFAPETLFLVVIVAIAAYFGYRMIRHGGFKGAMFGARIDHLVGEVAADSQAPARISLKVHLLRRDDSERLIGIELVTRSLASYHMTPVTLTVGQAEQLASLLQNAVRTH